MTDDQRRPAGTRLVLLGVDPASGPLIRGTAAARPAGLSLGGGGRTWVEWVGELGEIGGGSWVEWVGKLGGMGDGDG